MAARFWVGGTGTWDASDTSHWAATSGGSSGASVPTSSDTVTFDGNSGASAVITVNADVQASSVSLGTTGGNFTGTLDFATNNNSPTFGTFAFSGSGTRTLNMGSGTWTLNGTTAGGGFDISTATGLTFSGASATVALTGNMTVGRIFNVNTATTVGTLNIGANTSGGNILISGPTATLTITNLGITAPNRVVFKGGSLRVFTITNAATFTGSAGSYISLISDTGLSILPTVNGSITGTYCAVGGITFGTGTQAFTNSWNMGANSGAGYSLSAPAGGVVGVIGS